MSAMDVDLDAQRYVCPGLLFVWCNAGDNSWELEISPTQKSTIYMNTNTRNEKKLHVGNKINDTAKRRVSSVK